MPDFAPSFATALMAKVRISHFLARSRSRRTLPAASVLLEQIVLLGDPPTDIPHGVSGELRDVLVAAAQY
jgi:hypothetical protein